MSVVREVDPTADGWRVDERRPIEPPAVPDGVRADALANIAFLRRPVSMSPADWLDDWLERHTSVAIDTQGTFGYVQNPVIAPVTPEAPEVAGIVEELFSMAAMTDTHAFYGSGGDQAELDRRFSTLMESVARFGADHGLDLVPTSRYVSGAWREFPRQRCRSRPTLTDVRVRTGRRTAVATGDEGAQRCLDSWDSCGWKRATGRRRRP